MTGFVDKGRLINVYFPFSKTFDTTSLCTFVAKLVGSVLGNCAVQYKENYLDCHV